MDKLSDGRYDECVVVRHAPGTPHEDMFMVASKARQKGERTFKLDTYAVPESHPGKNPDWYKFSPMTP